MTRGRLSASFAAPIIGRTNKFPRLRCKMATVSRHISSVVSLHENTAQEIMRIARVFPRRTNLTPIDPLAYYGEPGMFDAADEVHISTLFTWDAGRADYLAEQWRHVAPIRFGGPADPRNVSGAIPFVPGMYVREGAVVTSRGCPNRCWFCLVPQRETGLFELPITEGWNLLDDNILACSELHIRNVFAMLKRQAHRSAFTGGLEAARLQEWHVNLLADLWPDRMFFAYDTPDDLEPLYAASKLLKQAGFTHHHMRCYVLIGWPRDSFKDAWYRLRRTFRMGFDPQAMLWRDKNGSRDPTWRKFARKWARPAIYRKMCAVCKLTTASTHDRPQRDMQS